MVPENPIPIRSFTNGSGSNLKVRPKILIGSCLGMTISNPKPDNKPEKRVNVIKRYLSLYISLYLNWQNYKNENLIILL